MQRIPTIHSSSGLVSYRYISRYSFHLWDFFILLECRTRENMGMLLLFFLSSFYPIFLRLDVSRQKFDKRYVDLLLFIVHVTNCAPLSGKNCHSKGFRKRISAFFSLRKFDRLWKALGMAKLPKLPTMMNIKVTCHVFLSLNECDFNTKFRILRFHTCFDFTVLNKASL